VGSGLGVLAWSTWWFGWLPPTGVHSPPWEQRSPRVLLPVLDHKVFGAAWVLAYWELGGHARPKRKGRRPRVRT
jgi:hypothetical protein